MTGIYKDGATPSFSAVMPWKLASPHGALRDYAAAFPGLLPDRRSTIIPFR